jgi:hypothetical protein
MKLPTVLISLEVDGSRKANGSHETFPDTCARARFAGCIFLRHIILALNIVYEKYSSPDKLPLKAFNVTSFRKHLHSM